MFEKRARGKESLDRPDSDPRLTERSLQLMQFVNRIGGGTRIVRRFLAAELGQTPHDEPVRVLDLGSGDCCIPLATTRWAQPRGYRLEFTCLDFNPKAVELARRVLDESACDNITAEQADAFSYQPAEPFDYALGSLFFHHFTDEEIDRLIEHLRGFVRKALLINDLQRSALNYVVASVLAVPIESEIRHDASLSIRRGFRRAELLRLLRRHDPAATVQRAWFRRIVGFVHFNHREAQ